MTQTLRLKNALAALILAATCGPLAAHELWIDVNPSDSSIDAGFSADLRVGQNLSGPDLPYLDTAIKAMTHVGPDEVWAIAARLGDRPAIGNLSAMTAGLHILTVETHPAYIVFDTMSEFEDYLAYEGLSDVANLHRDRGLPVSRIAEEYIRNARALVQVGPVDAGDMDRAAGMPFEIVVMGTPFAEGQQDLQVRLTWQGRAANGVQIALFHLPCGGSAPDDTLRVITRTGSDGDARFELKGAGKYLLSAVRMEPVDGPGNVVWQSHWASLTLDIKDIE
ncbi:DUF4198 domain-containing protein [Loktanella sp. IMCC34160]|uniref:DUF4198 domain-containing protein n=1 Tax=Loktanella sp. IMCC34160 TaxID=2510646 RepID=UPI00101D4980|nr:DUF4198 domain-containing protein [Loktanella sp. IMCC34160]RYG89987.1 DUF4198 domain-containing protein [Loktanella sp. IMCC34160]